MASIFSFRVVEKLVNRRCPGFLRNETLNEVEINQNPPRRPASGYSAGGHDDLLVDIPFRGRRNHFDHRDNLVSSRISQQAKRPVLALLPLENR